MSVIFQKTLGLSQTGIGKYVYRDIEENNIICEDFVNELISEAPPLIYLVIKENPSGPFAINLSIYGQLEWTHLQEPTHWHEVTSLDKSMYAQLEVTFREYVESKYSKFPFSLRISVEISAKTDWED